MQLANDIYRNELTYSFKFLLQFRHMFAGGDSKVTIWIGCLVHTVHSWMGWQCQWLGFWLDPGLVS